MAAAPATDGGRVRDLPGGVRMSDLWAALCLVAVIEGLFLFIVPGAWKRAVAQMLEMPDRQVRVVGAIVLALGLLSLYLVRG